MSHITRRLTAIMAADVVGFSRLMRVDEVGTLERLKSLRRERVQPKITKFKGRIVKFVGDGLLAEFPSVVDAVQCAVEIQQSISATETDVADEHRIQLRIGINLGDIIVEGSDIYGDGVNIASRLEGLAEPGGVCISDSVRTAVVNKLPFEYDDMGEREVKNIATPLRVHRVLTGSERSDANTATHDVLELPDNPSIAVLPFTNMSGDPEQEYFSDGITEDIITELSHHRDLFVTARNSSFAFRGKSPNVVEVGNQLNVRFVLEGSVRKSGSRVRITAQLIDAASGGHVWADRYDRDIEDIFELQDEVVRIIVATLVGQVELAGHNLAKRKPPSSLKSYDFVVQGLSHFYKWTPTDNSCALELFEQAIGIDPDYAPAFAWLAEAHFREGLNAWSASLEKSFSTFFDCASKAVALDENDSRTQTSLGVAYLFRCEHDLARYHLERALSLNPSDTRAMVHFARYESLAGNPERGVDYLREASRFNPLANYNWYAGQIYYTSRRYAEAVKALAALSSPNALVHAFIAAAHAQLGNDTEAAHSASLFVSSVENLVENSGSAKPDSWVNFVAVRFPFKFSEDTEHLENGLRLAGLS